MRSNQYIRFRILKHVLQTIIRIVIIQWNISTTSSFHTQSSYYEFLLITQHDTNKRRILLTNAQFYQFFSQGSRQSIQFGISIVPIFIHYRLVLRSLLSLLDKDRRECFIHIILHGLSFGELLHFKLLFYRQQWNHRYIVVFWLHTILCKCTVCLIEDFHVSLAVKFCIIFYYRQIVAVSSSLHGNGKWRLGHIPFKHLTLETVFTQIRCFNHINHIIEYNFGLQFMSFYNLSKRIKVVLNRLVDLLSHGSNNICHTSLESSLYSRQCFHQYTEEVFQHQFRTSVTDEIK